MLGNDENPRPRYSRPDVEKQNLQQVKLKPAQAANWRLKVKRRIAEKYFRKASTLLLFFYTRLTTKIRG